jgi:hypothetical protein
MRPQPCLPFRRRVAGRVALLLALLLAPAAARAEAIAWTPPPVGLTAVFDGHFMGETFEVAQRIVAVRGDEIVVESLPAGGAPFERYFRFLLSFESEGALYEFDHAAVAALWPLEPGRSASTKVSAVLQDMPLAFDWSGSVVGFEEIAVPAGRFRTARVNHSLVAPGLLSLETDTWLDTATGIPVRTETTVVVAGEAPQNFLLELRELR